MQDHYQYTFDHPIVYETYMKVGNEKYITTLEPWSTEEKYQGDVE